MMQSEVTKPVKLQSGGRTIIIRPHQSIRLPNIIAERLLKQAPDRIKLLKE